MTRPPSLLRRGPRVSVAACLALAACGHGPPGEGQKPPPAPVPVTVAAVARKDVPVEVRTIGAAEAWSTVQVMPQVGGVVQEVHFKEGDFVRKGALLFSIDTRPYQATLSAAVAELARSEALAEQARAEVGRYEKLAAEGLATDLELSQRRANSAALVATLNANRAAIQTNTINVQFATIRSPIDGRTGSLLVHAGNVVRGGDTRAMVVIRTLSPIYVRFALPEQLLADVRRSQAGGAVTVEARPRGARAPAAVGRLTFIENTVDSATGKIDMKAEFANEDQALWPGQLLDVTLRVSVEHDAVVVPEAAVQTGQDGAYTFVVGGDSKVELRRLEVERTAGGDAVVSRGVQPGEKVVVDGQVRLRSGSAVTVKDGTPGAPSAAPPASAGAQTAAAPAPSAGAAGR